MVFFQILFQDIFHKSLTQINREGTREKQKKRTAAHISKLLQISVILCALGCIYPCAENMHKEKENGKGTLFAMYVPSQNKR